MKLSPALTAVLTLAPCVALAQAPATAPAPQAFETASTFSAATYLPTELLSGPHYRVRDFAQSDGFLIHYTIDSDFSVYQCAGTRELKRSVGEIQAIAKLVEVSKGDLFAQGLKNSLTDPIDAVKHIVDDPVGSVKQVPKTVGHFFSKVGSGIENTGMRIGNCISGKDESDTEPVKNVGKSIRDLAGYQSAKLDTARQLGIDPYSDNTRLQQEIDKVTWAFFAGGLPLRVGTAAVSGGASAALTATKAVGLPEDIYELTPNELALRDREALIALGVEEAVADAILLNSKLSTSARHRIVLSLGALPASPGRITAAQLLASGTPPYNARVLADALEMLVARHRANPYASIKVHGRLPVGVLADGSVEIVAPVDYLSWTPLVSRFVGRDDLGSSEKRLVISCKVSEVATARLAAAGWTLVKPAG